LRLAAIGEFGFINRIKMKSRVSTGVILGIGDDAAVTAMTPGMVLLSTSDMLAQGVHFDLAWSDPATLGRKSLAVNLSDIAAMGGIPRYALLSLAIPADLPLEFMESFMNGFLEQADRYDVSLIGGDTSSSKAGLVISVTLLGEQYPDRIAKRSGACSGDIICVSGTPGDSALGLHLLKAGFRSGEAVNRHLDPVPQVELGRILAERKIPSAMIDISDGLHADLSHILEASAKGGRICIDAIPISDSFRKAVAITSQNYYLFPLAGGEDYELLFTLHPSKLKEAEDAASLAGTAISVIGEITEKSGLLLALADGSSYDSAINCYDHFIRN
jgi:thiamine-monophosphate kinase